MYRIYSVVVAFYLVLTLPLQHTFAQSGDRHKSSDGELYYYFGSKKINLSQSRTHLYVETNSLAATTSLQQMIAVARFTSGMQLQSLAVPTRCVFTLSNPDDFDSTMEWIRKQEGVLIARPAVYEQPDNEQIYEDAFYVKLKPQTNTLQFESEVAKTGSVIAERYAYDKRVYIVRAGSANAFDALKMANYFYETGLFEYAEPDFRALTLLHSTPPNDSLYALQWGMKNTGSAAQFNGVPGADIGVEAAWVITKGSPAIRIAVVDEGVERNHPDLVDNIDPLGFGLVPANATTGSPLGTARSHGTSCAGIIAARSDNNIGIAGVAPLCKIIPVNLTINSSGSFGTFQQLATCLDWSWNEGGADIISNSWGGGVPSSLVHDAIKRAITLGRGGKGSLVLFSSGNSDAGVSSPSIYPESISVGAMDMCYQRKGNNTCDAENFWGSNYGTGLDISAPGVKIATTRNGASYNNTFNGTSSSCPFVAGVAALVLSVNPGFTQVQARQIIERSARKVGNYTYSRVPGQPNGSWTPNLGYGMVSAANAVQAAQNFDFACKVSISATGPTQVCSGNTVGLLVADIGASSSYFWLRNGVPIPGGTSIQALTSGQYQAIVLRPNGCRDTSVPIEVRVAPSLGTLKANAGSDTVVCSGISHILGGGPAATGGTPFLHAMRGIAHNVITNELVRFDPLFPGEFFRTIKQDFNPNSSSFYCGAANTPFGVFMLDRNNQFVKVDTASGAITVMSRPIPQSGHTWNGMTYSPMHGKIFAISSNNAANLLYEIDIRTGFPTLLGTLNGASNMLLIWIAADAAGNLFAMRLASVASAQIFRIDLSSLSATALPSGTGFEAQYAQDAAFDLLTGKLLVNARTRALGSGSDYPGHGLWEANTTTGMATLIGSVGLPFSSQDATAFAGPEYTYSWSPTNYLSNPNDANPVFTGAPPGNYTYTLTVTDLCGQTAQSSVTIKVKPVVTPNAFGVLFVNENATGDNSGSSWLNAITNLQFAIQNSCHDVRQIWVARGTYRTTVGNNRDSAFTLKNNLTIYGGFAGTENSLTQRNLRVNPTILSGDIGTQGNRNDNAYNVISNINNGLNATAVLDGFIIRDGQANKAEYARQRGAGMININSSPLVINCIFTGNFTLVYGGAVFNEGATSTPTFVNCVFSGNQAQWGGGIYNESAQTRVFNSTFSSNEVANTGGAIYSYGTPLVTVRNSVIWGNTNGVTTAPIDNSTAIQVTHSIVQGGYTGTGNVQTNPLFKREAPIGLGQLGDLRLLACSPGVNTGSNAGVPAGISLELRSLSRIAGVAVDMGAYERPSNTPPAVIFVDAAASGLNDGTSWTNAYTSLQDALRDLNNCGSGATPTIQIARGTYTIPAGLNLVLDKVNAFLLGGFPAIGGVRVRNPEANPVIIKGSFQVLKNATVDGVKLESGQ